jgi:Tol biopolymer transport system component
VVDVNGGVAISADGRFVAFGSAASNLVPADTNGAQDIFVRDRLRGKTRLVSVNRAGKPANGPSLHPALSPDGRFVAFASGANDLVAGDGNTGTDIFLRDLKSGKTRRMSVKSSGGEADGACFRPSVTPAGDKVVFECTSVLVPGDSNGQMDVFLRDVAHRRTSLISVSRSGGAGDEGGFSGAQPSISPNGRMVVFNSAANDLVAGDGGDGFDAFVRNLRTQKTRRLSLSPSVSSGNGGTGLTTISPDGVWVAFESDASNLVAGDTNASTDVFLRRLARGPIRRFSVSSAGRQGDVFSEHPSLSNGGRTAAFDSLATNLSGADGSPFVDVFARRLRR